MKFLLGTEQCQLMGGDDAEKMKLFSSSSRVIILFYGSTALLQLTK